MVYSAEPGRKAAYSCDLRWRIVWQRFGTDLPIRKIASNLNVSVGTVHNVTKTFENTGDVTNKPDRLGIHSRALTSSEQIFVIGVILKNPCLYLRELCSHVEDISGASVSVSTLCRLLHSHGLTRKQYKK